MRNGNGPAALLYKVAWLAKLGMRALMEPALARFYLSEYFVQCGRGLAIAGRGSGGVRQTDYRTVLKNNENPQWWSSRLCG